MTNELEIKMERHSKKYKYKSKIKLIVLSGNVPRGLSRMEKPQPPKQMSAASAKSTKTKTCSKYRRRRRRGDVAEAIIAGDEDLPRNPLPLSTKGGRPAAEAAATEYKDLPWKPQLPKTKCCYEGSQPSQKRYCRSRCRRRRTRSPL